MSKIKLFKHSEEAVEKFKAQFGIVNLEAFYTNKQLHICVGTLEEGQPFLRLFHTQRFPELTECMSVVNHFWGDVETIIYAPTPIYFSAGNKFNELTILLAHRLELTKKSSGLILPGNYN